MKSVSFGLISIVVILWANTKLSTFPHEESLNFCFEKDFKELSLVEGPYTIILGNSRSLSSLHAGSLSTLYNQPVLHLGYSSSNLETAALTLDYALRTCEKIERVLIEVSPFHFDSRRVHAHGIRHYMLQRNPSLLFTHGNSWKDWSNAFPSTSTLPRMKSILKPSGQLSDYSKRWNCEDSTFQKNERKWLEAFPDRHLRFESRQQSALMRINSECRKRDITLTVFFTPTDTAFRAFFNNYGEYKDVVRELLGIRAEIIDTDNGNFQNFLQNPDHVACPEVFTENILVPLLSNPQGEHNALQLH